MQPANIYQYKVWDLPVRLFHWINFFAVLSLLFMGLMMLFKKELGITSLEARIELKEIHVLIGYVFVINLLIRLAWGFIGQRFARWSQIWPTKAFFAELKAYRGSIKAGKAFHYAGHNPLGRLAINLLYLLLLVMAVSGLVRAGTDIYFPPFGSLAASYVAAEGVSPEQIHPYDKTGTDAQHYAELKEFKGPFGSVHLYTAWILLSIILLHVAAVIRAEVKEDESLVSAMISGRKGLPGKARDMDEDGSSQG
ncbi:MAG: cytochrome b/b6 domain-containing protein [gamma proteobacterium symbiont of Bathyaustriella thionipta]|nr:cytochrome b/b6 domain-containing protein [gamma proteobacterium symbiont of Bathyaustriella thionipta]